jgi:hypothetical protein
LILSNGTEYEDNLVMYSFFINRKHISSEWRGSTKNVQRHH